MDAIKDKIKNSYEFDKLHMYVWVHSSQVSFDLEKKKITV